MEQNKMKPHFRMIENGIQSNNVVCGECDLEFPETIDLGPTKCNYCKAERFIITFSPDDKFQSYANGVQKILRSMNWLRLKLDIFELVELYDNHAKPTLSFLTEALAEHVMENVPLTERIKRAIDSTEDKP